MEKGTEIMPSLGIASPGNQSVQQPRSSLDTFGERFLSGCLASPNGDIFLLSHAEPHSRFCFLFYSTYSKSHYIELKKSPKQAKDVKNLSAIKRILQ